MKKVVLINGSPRLEEATTSAELVARAAVVFPDGVYEKQILNVRKSLKNGPEADFPDMQAADALLFVFPLYYFCLPGLLMRFLEDYEAFCRAHGGQQKPAKVYAIVNCGFPEPEINTEAVRVIGCFSRHIGAQFRFGVLIGSGPMLTAAQDAPPVKKALEKLDAAVRTMAKDIAGEETSVENVLIASSFPRRLYFLMGDMNWKREAKRNGLKKADLYRRPYQQAI